MKILHSILLFLLFIPTLFMGQKIDNTASYRDIKSDKYIRLNYENDLFTSSDLDYTQGVNFEFVTPSFAKNPVNYLLISSKNSEKRYGIALEHFCFTADDIGSYEIQYGDRPFAAGFMVKSFSIATDTIRKARVVSSLSLGIIGPGAAGGDLQKAMHRLIGSEIPNGWYYQIKNDLILNYELSYDKELLRFNNLFSLQANGGVKLGTLFTNAALGLNASLGIINSPFTSVKDSKKFQLYVYCQPLVNAIGYDATLQGGLIDRKSVYTIPNSDIERFTLQNNFGVVFQFAMFYFEYTETLLTREISTANPHNWGGIRIGYKL